MKFLHLPVRACSKVLLLVARVWLVLPLTASSGVILALEIWCQASPPGLLGRPHLVKIMLCWGSWQDRFISAQALMARMKNLYGMSAGWKTINNWLLVHGYCAYRPSVGCQPPLSLHGVGIDVAEPGHGSLAASHLQRWVQIPTLPGRWQA